MASSAVAASNSLLDKKLDHPVHSNGRRLAIILAYWAVVFVGLPVWWWMTSIQRLPLPALRIERLHERTLKFPVRVLVNVGDLGHDPVSFCDALQQQLSRLEREDMQGWDPLSVQLSCYSHTGSEPDIGTLQEDMYVVRLKGGAGTTTFRLNGRTLIVDARAGDPSLPFEIMELIRDLLLPYSQGLHSVAAESRVAQYAERYNLAFTLLNEDASVGGAVSSWDIEAALDEYILPTVHQMAGMHVFSIESQLQWFGSLAPELIASTYDSNGTESWHIPADKLPVFVNSAEWTLSSGVSNDPVLHFILFVPSAARRPVHVDAAIDSVQRSDAFIVPQWGGVFIYNPDEKQEDRLRNMHLGIEDLSQPFTLFRTQLYALLGVPELPPQVNRPMEGRISPWQLEALRRRRALENARNSIDTLQSIVSLVRQIDNMPVGPDVVGQVDGALDALDKVTESMESSLSQTLYHTIQAFILSSKAFFNPGMIGLLYYPTEHKYAVYTPLFAPVTVPLVVAVIRELKAWRDRTGAGALRQKEE